MNAKTVCEKILESLQIANFPHIKLVEVEPYKKNYILRITQNNNKYITFEIDDSDVLDDLCQNNTDLFQKTIIKIKEFLRTEYQETKNCKVIYNQDSTDVLIQDPKKTNHKSGLVAILFLILPIAVHADFSFNNYQYTLNYLRSQHLTNEFSHYTINFSPTQNDGTINSYVYQNGTLTPVSYNYTLTPNAGDHGGGVVLHNGDDLNVYWHNETNYNLIAMPATINTIGTISGDFITNSGSGQAGGLTNNAFTINNLYGDFIENSSTTSGGGIVNLENGLISNITGNFLNNIGTRYGGGIDNEATITNMTTNFIRNTVNSPYQGDLGFGQAYGGAIYNAGNMTNISGDFIDNRTHNSFTSGITSYVISSGGGIYNGDYRNDFGTTTNPSIINSISGKFIGNSASIENNYSFNTSGNWHFYADGGAITNKYNSQIQTINADFYNNFAKVENTGSITDASAIWMTARGGAIYNNGTINNITGDFINNHATVDNSGNLDAGNVQLNTYGGAIFNSGTINLSAVNDSILFSGNTATTGGAIYNSGTITMDIGTGKQIRFATSSDDIYNSGTITMTGNGYLYLQSISGDGIFNIDGLVGFSDTATVTQNSLQLTENGSMTINANSLLASTSTMYPVINNNGTLTLTGGTLSWGISGSGNTIINGDVTNNTFISGNQVTINYGKSLTSATIGSSILNNGTLYLTGGTLDNAFFDTSITGSGTIITMGDISGNANKFGNNIVNDYTLTLNGGTLNTRISGDGTLVTTGNVTIDVTGAYYDTGYVSVVENNIQNNGTLTLVGGGRLCTNISGDGNVVINNSSGFVVSVADDNIISESITINNGANLNASANSIGGNVINNGQLHLWGGTLTHNIAGTGYTGIHGNTETSANNLLTNISLSGLTESEEISLTLTDGTLQRVISNGNNANNNIIIDGDVLSSPSNLLVNVSVNDGAVLTLTNGTLSKNITGNGTLSISNLTTYAKNLGINVNNTGNLALTGGTITHNITGTGQTTINGAVTNNALISQTMVVNSGKSLTTAASGIGANILNNGNVTLTGGTVNHNITGGGTVTIDGNIVNNGSLGLVAINENKSLTTSADSIYGISSNNGTLYLNGGTLGYSVNGDVYITGNVTNTASQWQSINISNGGTFTTTANLLTNNNAIVNDGTLNITGGNLQQNVTGGNTIIAQNATTSATSFGNLELNGVMNVGTNTVNMANADINGTINLGISALNKNSNLYTGGHIVADDITFGDNAKLSLTITDTNLQKGDSTGDLSIITANGTWTGDFDVLTSNNLYDITYNDNSHTFTFARKKFGADLITELNGTELDVNVATVWDELQSSNNQNVQSIINAIDYNSQHNAKKYATLIHNLAPHNNQITVGAIRNVNTAINNRVTARLATVRTSTVTNNDVNRHQPNRYNRNPYYYMGYQGRSGGDVAPVTNNGLWVEGLYNYAQQNDDTKFSGKTFGVTGGFDSKLTEHLTAGLGYAFNKTTIDADNHDIDATGHTGFVYAEYKPTQWYLDALLSYNMTNYQDSSALVDNLSVKSDYKTNSFGGSVISGYDFQKGYDLYGGLNYIGIKQDAYTDTASQKIKADDTQTLTLTAGGKYRITSQNMKRASTILKAAVLYDVMSDDGVTTVTVGNNNYIVRGNGVDPFGVQAGIMFDALGNNANLSIGYDLEWRNNFISHTGYIKLKYNF